MERRNPGDTPGPLALFCARLKRLQKASGLSQTALAGAVHLGKSQMADILNGQIKRLPDRDVMIAVVRACLAHAEDKGKPVPEGLRDEGDWHRRYDDLEHDLDAGPWPVLRREAAAGWPLAKVIDPFALEVHQPVQPSTPQDGLPVLPAYLPREHDAELKRVASVAAQGHSGLAVLVGGSSTGKTRACWEVLQLLRDQPEPWRLWHPIGPSRPEGVLRELPSVRPRTVVWLNEAQFYLGQDNGEQVAAGLRELLRDPGRAPVLVLATMWNEYWHDLAVRPPAGVPDPHSQARDLLADHDIAVPPDLTAAEMERAAAAGDPRLAQAATMAKDGRVIQFLAGVPELISRYEHALPAERALLDTAIDARRLGMGTALPRAFLQEAAVGYIAAADWDELARQENWLAIALASTRTPSRGVRGPLAPDRVLPDACQLADYLEQHGRRTRRACFPPGEFWLAAARHASPGDLAVLADAAESRGLLKDAAVFRKHATLHGNTTAAADIVRQFHDMNPGDLDAAQWAARHASLDDPRTVAILLRELGTSGAADQIDALFKERDPARSVSLGNLHGVEFLLFHLRKLRRASAEQQVAMLADRAAKEAPLDDPGAVADLLHGLREAGAAKHLVAVLVARAVGNVSVGNLRSVVRLVFKLDDVRAAKRQIFTLVARAAKEAPLDDPGAVADLLNMTRWKGLWWHAPRSEVAAELLAQPLIDRDPAGSVSLDDLSGVVELLRVLRAAGEEGQVNALIARDPVNHASIDDLAQHTNLPYTLPYLLQWDRTRQQVDALIAGVPLHNPDVIAMLLHALWRTGAEQQVNALMDRHPAQNVPLDSREGVALLLRSLREAAAEQQVKALIDRDPAGHVSLDSPYAVANLLCALLEAGADQQVNALMDRHPAENASLKETDAAGVLLRALLEAGADQQVNALIARMPTEGEFRLFLAQPGNREQYRFGREPDGNKAPRWGWDDLDD